MRRDYYILFVRNALKQDTTPAIEEFRAWVQRNTPLNLTIEYVDTNLPLRWKDFGTVLQGGDVGKSEVSSWGLDGIKQQLRDANVVQSGGYDLVAFLYDLEDYDGMNPIAAWTYPNPFEADCGFFETPVGRYSNGVQFDVARILTHELIHVLIRQLWWNGIYNRKDDMDLYDLEYCMTCPNGNRMRNLARITPDDWKVIGQEPVKRGIIKLLTGFLTYLKSLMPKPKEETKPIPPPPSTETPMRRSRILEWAVALQKYEGWYPGSRSWRNNNPGNFRFNEYVRVHLGASGQDEAGFAKWPGKEEGFDALCQHLRWAASGELKRPKPDWTLLEFFAGKPNPQTGKLEGGYAPQEDHNEPNSYAVFVAMELKVDPKTQIKELV